jgi:peptidoglycan/xylan/chitin deacetylase (PgdA/CDA1 family)
VSTLKSIARATLAQAAAGIAPPTWRWRAPGSLLILTYHRVLPSDSPERLIEQPGMYVSPQTLDLHLSQLGRRFELVHLDDWMRRAGRGEPLPRLACALTFDDGWRDNFQFALPVLRRHGAPATIFLVSRYIGSAQRFWPNRLMSLLAKSFGDPDSVRYPEALRPIVEPALAVAAQRGVFRVEDADRAIVGAKRFDEQRIRDLIAAAERSCGPTAQARDTLSGEEVAQMAATGLVRFGSHTATHFRLGGRASLQELEREISLSKRELQDICGQEIDLFCYPNGETSTEAVAWVRRNYLGAVTSRQGWHRASADPHLVRRIGVHEDISNTASSFLARVSGWL